MKRQWGMAAVVVLGLGGTLGGINYKQHAGGSPNRRLTDPSFEDLEKQVGRPLYAPSWLPEGMAPVEDLSQQGQFRILMNFSDPKTDRWLILAQEARTAERDVYHEKRLIPRADVEADVSGARAYLMRGTSGDRRVVWRTPDAWLILSSYQLSDFDLLRVARSIRSSAAPARAAVSSSPGDPGEKSTPPAAPPAAGSTASEPRGEAPGPPGGATAPIAANARGK